LEITNNALTHIDNSFPGLLYKTKDFNKIESFKVELTKIIEGQVIVNMEGSMVTSIETPTKCDKLLEILGHLNFIIDSKTFPLNLSSFLYPSTSDRSNCTIDLQIVVFNEA
jgi:hypothetical protein